MGARTAFESAPDKFSQAANCKVPLRVGMGTTADSGLDESEQEQAGGGALVLAFIEVTVAACGLAILEESAENTGLIPISDIIRVRTRSARLIGVE